VEARLSARHDKVHPRQANLGTLYNVADPAGVREDFLVRVCRRGMGYLKTHTPTVSGELEMSPGRDT